MKTLHFLCTSWFATLLGLAPFFSAAKAQSRDNPKINGQVVAADGTPVAGATVETIQDCFQGGDSIETRKTISAADGTFSLPAYDTRCSRYRLLASKEGDFWLPSDDLMPQFGPPPTQRIVVDISKVSSSRSVIVLKERGGKVAIRVRDVATGRFVFAELVYEKPDQDNVSGASMPTGLDGSATVHLLPPGEYIVKVFSFSCGDSREEWHVTADSPKISVLVKPGVELNEVIEIDSRKIKILSNNQGKVAPDSSSPNCGRQGPESATKQDLASHKVPGPTFHLQSIGDGTLCPYTNQNCPNKEIWFKTFTLNADGRVLYVTHTPFPDEGRPKKSFEAWVEHAQKVLRREPELDAEGKMVGERALGSYAAVKGTRVPENGLHFASCFGIAGSIFLNWKASDWKMCWR